VLTAWFGAAASAGGAALIGGLAVCLVLAALSLVVIDRPRNT
jgi:hypothetical protein